MIEHRVPALHCGCGGTLDLGAAQAACMSCGAVVTVDGVGVWRLTSSDESWTSVPEHVAGAVRDANSAEELVEAMLGPHRPWSVPLQRRLLHPASGGAAALLEPPLGAAVLDLGTGWATLPAALSSLGVSVVTADWVYLRVRLERLLHDAPRTVGVHLGWDEPLPWTDAAFDVVFVDLEEVERVCRARGGAPEAKGRLLAEVRRVLSDDGTVVVGARNRLRTALRAGVAGSVGRRRPDLRALGTPPWEDPALRRAGLRAERLVLSYPDRQGWRWMVPGGRLSEHGFHSSTARGRAVRLAMRSGLAKWVVRDSYVLARHTTSSEAPVRTLGEALVGADGPPPATRALSDARVALLGRGSFIKFPLSVDQQRALVAEVDKTRQARGTAFAPYVVRESRIEHWRGVPYSVTPAESEATGRGSTARDTVAAALGCLDASHVGPLSTTSWWTRLSSVRGRSDAEEIGASALRSAVLQSGGASLVPIGPSHGDLHPGNVLVPVSGPPLLVDWNRFELVNPLLLDAVYAATRAHQAAAGISLAEALLDFVDGRVSGSVADRATVLLGELTPLQAAGVVLLDRVVSYSLPRRRHKPWTMPPLQEAVRCLTERALIPHGGGWEPAPAENEGHAVGDLGFVKGTQTRE